VWGGKVAEQGTGRQWDVDDEVERTPARWRWLVRAQQK
jgi:hypothetical protein